jgi:hypothetical protein
MQREIGNQDGSGFGQRIILKKGQEAKWLLLIINLLTILEIYVFATEAEEFPGEEEPVAGDFQDPAEFERAHTEWNNLVDRLSKNIRTGIGAIVQSLIQSDYIDQASRILRAVPAWTIVQVWNYINTGFVARTEKQIEQARDNFEKCEQGDKEKIGRFASRITSFAKVFESINNNVAVTPYQLLSRFLKNVNPTFRGLCMVLQERVRVIKDFNDGEPDPNDHREYPEFNVTVQELEAFEADNVKTIHEGNDKKMNKDKKKKSDKALVVSKQDFAKLNSWKNAQSTQSKSEKNSSTKKEMKRGICYNFRNTGDCTRRDCPYEHTGNIPRGAPAQKAGQAGRGQHRYQQNDNQANNWRQGRGRRPFGPGTGRGAFGTTNVAYQQPDVPQEVNLFYGYPQQYQQSQPVTFMPPSPQQHQQQPVMFPQGHTMAMVPMSSAPPQTSPSTNTRMVYPQGGSFRGGFNGGAAVARPYRGPPVTESTTTAEDDDDSSSCNSSMPELIADTSEDYQDFSDMDMVNGVPVLTLYNPTRIYHFNNNGELVEGLPPPATVAPTASRHIDARHHYVRDLRQNILLQHLEVTDQPPDDHTDDDEHDV